MFWVEIPQPAGMMRPACYFINNLLNVFHSQAVIANGFTKVADPS
jgi:hypothetical protein